MATRVIVVGEGGRFKAELHKLRVKDLDRDDVLVLSGDAADAAPPVLTDRHCYVDGAWVLDEEPAPAALADGEQQMEVGA